MSANGDSSAPSERPRLQLKPRDPEAAKRLEQERAQKSASNPFGEPQYAQCPGKLALKAAIWCHANCSRTASERPGMCVAANDLHHDLQYSRVLLSQDAGFANASVAYPQVLPSPARLCLLSALARLRRRS